MIFCVFVLMLLNEFNGALYVIRCVVVFRCDNNFVFIVYRLLGVFVNLCMYMNKCVFCLFVLFLMCVVLMCVCNLCF